MKGEHFVDQFTGWALEISRQQGMRDNAKHRCFGINYWVKRVKANNTYPDSGPGDNVIEAPLYADYFSLLNLNWKFGGDDTRMVFSSTHAMGPTHEFGHCGYENDTLKTARSICKIFGGEYTRQQCLFTAVCSIIKKQRNGLQ